ncbi:hypothetical protein C8Q76DRAFT_157376 [Earliella scabrosa]|nr:hypothetical protein C8Q76DRAFT_157376 [Earliella scabrosa]
MWPSSATVCMSTRRPRAFILITPTPTRPQHVAPRREVSPFSLFTCLMVGRIHPSPYHASPPRTIDDSSYAEGCSITSNVERTVYFPSPHTRREPAGLHRRSKDALLALHNLDSPLASRYSGRGIPRPDPESGLSIPETVLTHRLGNGWSPIGPRGTSMDDAPLLSAALLWPGHVGTRGAWDFQPVADVLAHVWVATKVAVALIATLPVFAITQSGRSRRLRCPAECRRCTGWYGGDGWV